VRRRLWRVRLREFARIYLAGLVGLGGHAGAVPPDVMELFGSVADPPCPPLGHPERAVPHVPPTPVEYELWGDLIGYRRD
jgi:hypothetical protein